MDFEIPQFVGTLPGWITATGTVGLLGLLIKAYLGNKKLSLDSEGDIRDHYATEVSSLRMQVTELTKANAASLQAANERYEQAIKASDERHRRCEKEAAVLRRRVSQLERNTTQSRTVRK